MRLQLLILMFILTAGNVSAQEALGGFEDVGVVPPSLPGQEAGRLTTTFILEYDGMPITNAHAIISLKNKETGESAGKLQFTQDGKVSIPLKQGRWAGTIGVDEATILGSDYFANLDFAINSDTTITPPPPMPNQ